MKKFKIVFLGCPKNLVDTEYLFGSLIKEGFEYSEEGECVFIQTCAFIKDAINESYRVIKKYVEKKKRGEIKFIGVGGCLPLRLKNKILEDFPEIDLIIENKSSSPRFFLTKGFAYLKISEGCNEKCSFCLIPSIKGNLKSKTIEEIIKEVKLLLNLGFKEIIIVSQSTGQYGIDIYKKPYFKNLLKEIDKINKDFWIRIMYMHPADVDEELIEIIKNSNKIVKYMDIPIQHFSSNVLKNMRRRGGREKVLNSLEIIRKEFDENFFIRSELIVGFPGETEKDFEELLKGIEYYKINRIAIFKYSDEKKINIKKVPKKIIDERFLEVEKLSKKLMEESQRKLLGKKLKCLIIEENKSFYKGRTEFDAPEIDFEVYTKKSFKIEIPGFYTLKIKSMKKDFDLKGEIC